MSRKPLGITVEPARRIASLFLSEDLVILGFILLGVYSLYPFYRAPRPGLLVFQESAAVFIILLGAVLRSKMRSFLSKLQPFVEEILVFAYMFVLLLVISLLVPYLCNPGGIEAKTLYYTQRAASSSAWCT